MIAAIESIRVTINSQNENSDFKGRQRILLNGGAFNMRDWNFIRQQYQKLIAAIFMIRVWLRVDQNQMAEYCQITRFNKPTDRKRRRFHLGRWIRSDYIASIVYGVEFERWLILHLYPRSNYPKWNIVKHLSWRLNSWKLLLHWIKWNRKFIFQVR